MSKEKYTVSDVMKEFGFSRKEALNELKDMGLDLKSTKSEISEDLVELVKEHFQDLLDQKSVAPKTNKNSSKEKSEDEKVAALAEVHLKPPIIVKKLAVALDKKPNELISALMKKGIMANLNQTIDQDIAIDLSKDFGFDLILDKREKQETSEPDKGLNPEEIEFEDNPKDLIEKPPVVTFLGHVDHGKTSLQDKIRKTNIVSSICNSANSIL
jgi:translation initiation factor IF-2